MAYACSSDSYVCAKVHVLGRQGADKMARIRQTKPIAADAAGSDEFPAPNTPAEPRNMNASTQRTLVNPRPLSAKLV